MRPQIKKAEGVSRLPFWPPPPSRRAQVLHRPKGVRREALILQAEAPSGTQILPCTGRRSEAIQTVFAGDHCGGRPSSCPTSTSKCCRVRRSGVQAVDASLRSYRRTGVHLEGFQPGLSRLKTHAMLRPTTVTVGRSLAGRTAVDLHQGHVREVAQKNIRFIRLWFTRMLGVLGGRRSLVAQLEEALARGVGFDGSAVEG